MAEISLTMDSVSMATFATKKDSSSKMMSTDSVSKDKKVLNPESDEALLIAVGNEESTEAFNALFNRFANKIFAHGMKVTRNEQLAKDLVQEAMLTVWKKAPLYDLDRGNAASWIFTLTRNRCFDMLRKQKRQPNCVNAEDIWPEDFEDRDASTESDRAYINVELSQIQKYLDKLPIAQQQVIEQIYLLDRTHEEAAVQLDIPLGTLKSRLRLAMGKLRQLTGNENEQ